MFEDVVGGVYRMLWPVSLSHQEDPRTGQDRRDGAEKSGAKLGVRLLCAPPPPRTHPFRTITPILAPEPSVLVRKAPTK